jgi:Dyp-type peroxidase family
MRDHFGFAEGLSQPVFFESEARRTNGWQSGWDPSAALTQVLSREPGAPGGDEYGSFMAYLKIQQSKRDFAELVDEAAAAVHVSPSRVKAWIMGRSIDGAPLTGGATDVNDFDFAQDQAFASCPAGAHVRKMNPRLAHTRAHRIVRRGVLYENAGEDCGTLFQCFQSRLEAGFEKLFRDWALHADFPQPAAGPDAILGARDHPPLPAGIAFEGTAVPFRVRSFTRVLDGEYFYFPSIPFFKRMAGA